MIMTGEWLTKQAVDTYWGFGMIDDWRRVGIATNLPNHEKAFEILDGLKPKLKKNQKEKICRGELKVSGATTCDNPKCRQCINEKIKGIVIVKTTKEDRDYIFDKIKDRFSDDAQLIKTLNNEREFSSKLLDRIEELEENEAKRIDKIKSRIPDLTSTQTTEDVLKSFKEEIDSMNEDMNEEEEELDETVKLGKWEVDKYLLESYAQTIRGMQKAMSPFSPTSDPILGMELYQKRVKLHKEIFKSVNVPYHQDVHPLNHKRQFKESKKLYDLIEEWITKNHPDIDKKSRFDIERMKNNG